MFFFIDICVKECDFVFVNFPAQWWYYILLHLTAHTSIFYTNTALSLAKVHSYLPTTNPSHQVHLNQS